MCSSTEGDAISALSTALDGLTAESLGSAFGPHLLDRLRPLLVAQNRLAAEIARTVRQCELTQAPEVDGLKTMGSWLRGHGLLTSAAAAKLVRAGRTLEQLPAVAATAGDGHVTPEQVAVVAKVVTPRNLGLAADQGVDLDAVDRVLAEVAATQPHDTLVEVVERYTAQLDPDGLEPDPTEGRSLTWSRNTDGSLSGRFDLDAVGGEKFVAAVESILQANRPAGDERTRTQQQADALVQLCDLQLASGNLPTMRTVKPHVIVRIDLDDLADPAPGPTTADTGFGAQISAARARHLACDGQISRVIFGPDGAPTDLGRTHRVVPPHLRRAVELRDRGCVFTGCGAPSHWCDVHHVLEWINDGETSLENSALLCERHHTKVHHGFRVERQPDGRWRTWRPDGTEIVLHPHVLAA